MTGEEQANALLRTLVTQGKSGAYFVFVIPAAAEGRQLCRATVEYACEARLGEKISVTAEEAGSCFYISGDGEKKIFRMLMEYR